MKRNSVIDMEETSGFIQSDGQDRGDLDNGMTVDQQIQKTILDVLQSIEIENHYCLKMNGKLEFPMRCDCVR